MIQYFEAFLFIFIPLFAWLLVSYNLLIREKIRMDTSNNELRSSIETKIKLTETFIKYTKQHLPGNKEMCVQLEEISDKINVAADIFELVIDTNLLEESINNCFKQIEQDENTACMQEFIDIRHLLIDIDARIRQNIMQYDLAAKYLNTRLGTFPANLFAKFFRIKPELRISKSP